MAHINPPCPAGTRVIVGLSGGVDSAVAALLLREAGLRVEALHMTNWDDDDGYCTAARDLQDARRVAGMLGIPLHHVNFARDYRRQVFDDFLAGLRAGITPNPDILCNREIKFGRFLDYAKRLGAERVATGHYARTAGSGAGTRLLRGRDPAKDQSYFLTAVPTEALAEAIFPVGDIDKRAVRDIARDYGLPPHDKKDSTGICFVGERPFREFLSHYLPSTPGPIVTSEGVEVGRHEGLCYYTLGQRQGLGIGGRDGASGEPWYVAAKEPARNVLVVVQGDHPRLYSDDVTVGACNWIGPSPFGERDSVAVTVKLRYRQKDQGCRIERDGAGSHRVWFNNPQRAVTPGQFAVFYDGERCLGGGMIETVLTAASDAEAPADAGA